MLESLRDRIAGQVFTDPIRTGLLSTDGSIYRIKPAAVVYPASTGFRSTPAGPAAVCADPPWETALFWIFQNS
ncbi:MAG: hypothetical protein NTU74_02195 [Deltaproteobacteria bacterium]|nr:hypothetical protein [Deltaproteobacteria bacterium]